MAIIDRLARLFKADLNAVLDRIEEPEALLKHAVREMEDELVLCERRIHALRQEQQQILQQQDEIEQSLAKADEELDICFAAGNDELARSLIRRKLEAQAYLRALARRHDELEKTLREREARLQDNRAQYESMRQKAKLLCAEAPAGDFRDRHAAEVSDPGVDQAAVEIALLREKQRRGKAPQSAVSSKQEEPS